MKYFKGSFQLEITYADVMGVFWGQVTTKNKIYAVCPTERSSIFLRMLLYGKVNELTVSRRKSKNERDTKTFFI